MKRLFIALSAVVIALSVMAKERVSVLYVGGSPDFDNIAVKKDSAIVAKSAKMRTADFEKFLRQRFYKVKAIQGKDYTAEMSKDYDVTVFDGKPKALRGEIIERDDQGRVIRFERPKYLPDDFDRAAVCIAEASEDLGRSLGSKNDWFCLCLENYAHNWNKDHPVFKGPFKVNIKSEMRPTPANAFEYCPMYGYTLPEQTEMWLVHPLKDGGRIGMVSRPWGYLDSPEAEVISSGVCAKSIDAVAIGRHGNMFHWGFSAKPSDLTEPAKAALANAIVYMKDFNGKRIIARKLNEGIATRDQVTAKKYFDSEACNESTYKSNVEFYEAMKAVHDTIDAKNARGETLTEIEQMYAGFPLSEVPVEISFDEYICGREPELYKVFGDDAAEYARYYEKNTPYFRADGYNLIIDEDARSLKIANNDIRLLDKAVELLSGNEKQVAMGRRILERYTLCRFATPAEWKAWLDANRNRMFFTEAGGWLWLVNTYDPDVPGNDYSVLEEVEIKDDAPAKPAGATDEQNPVALKAGVVNNSDGTKDIELTMTVHPGYHTYAIVADSESFIPTEVTIEMPDGWQKVGELRLPSPSPSPTATTWYTGNCAFRQRVKGSGPGSAEITIRYQVCDESICLSPVTRTFSINL